MAMINEKAIRRRVAGGGVVLCTSCGDRTIGVNYCQACDLQPLCGYCWRTEHFDHDSEAESEVDEWGMNLNQRS